MREKLSSTLKRFERSNNDVMILYSTRAVRTLGSSQQAWLVLGGSTSCKVGEKLDKRVWINCPGGTLVTSDITYVMSQCLHLFHRVIM